MVGEKRSVLIVFAAMKFTISDTPQPIDSLLRSCIGDFLTTLKDPDLNVRRVALVAFNSAAHNKPSLIRDLLRTILPQLYNETKVTTSFHAVLNAHTTCACMYLIYVAGTSVEVLPVTANSYYWSSELPCNISGAGSLSSELPSACDALTCTNCC